MMDKRWIITLLCVSIVAFVSCNNKNKQGTVTEREIIVMEPEVEVTADSISSDLIFLSEWVGKYPKEVSLFKLNVITSRLQQLMGNQYDSLIANWNTETPIQLEDSIIHTSGCKAQDCPADSYELYVDLKDNNINVYNFQNDKLHVYEEKGKIALPNKMKADLNIIKSNAKLTKR